MRLFALTSSSGDTYAIEEETLFGRGTECTIRLDDSEVSRKHALIFVEGETLMVRDKGSANGTFVNAQRVEGVAPLKNGDQIRMGQTVMIVQVTDAEDVTPTVLVPEKAPVPEKVPLPEKVPVAEVVESTQISEDPLSPKKKSKLPVLLIGCGGLVLVTLCVFVVVFVVSGAGFFQDLLGGLDLFSGEADIVSYSLEEVLQEDVVDDRPGVIGYLGRPDAFTISAITMEGVPVRVETWRYFAFEMRVDFVDGEATWTMDIEPAPEDSILPAWYDPLAFELGMSPSEVAVVAASASPAGQTPEAIDLSEGGEDLVGSTMLVGDQILIGLDPSGLVYVETIALFPEGEGGS
jgi:pSer/pThr/pTyr-binding forkhead associated (FHA) protein